MTEKLSPFRSEYFLGYINQVSAQHVKIHFPSSVLLNGFIYDGKEFNGGLVGSFVVIEGEINGFLGRITELVLPESERLSLNERAFQTSDFHPTGKIEILLSFNHYDPFKIKKGLTNFPKIGAKVFVSSGELIQKYMTRFGLKPESKQTAIRLGYLVNSPTTSIDVNMQSIFGRHCAVVGTTGGGKSYTVTKLAEKLIETNNKVILIDATGEYSDNFEKSMNIKLGDGTTCFHYSQLSIDDIFFMLKPSDKTQKPRLMEAIRTLKMVQHNQGNNFKRQGYNDVPVANGVVMKSGLQHKAFKGYYYDNVSDIEDGKASFDITKLNTQLNYECVWDNVDTWGKKNDTEVGYCVSLMARINNLLHTPEYNQIFGFDQAMKATDLTKQIDKFITSADKNILKIDLKDVKYDFQIRETIVNSIGKYLLAKARGREFSTNPIVVMVDEAHQFLNKNISDEYFEAKPLDAFDSIAKECRKYGLFLCIATQMPRDIPRGTLSQMGTFIVHRLINPNDKESIANACSSANRNTLDFLPILGEGEAILTGVDFSMPIIMKFDLPNKPPNSNTPQLK